MKLTKSWSLTLATITITIATILLPSFGITTITETQITNLIYMALGLSGIGAGNATMKRITKDKSKQNTNSIHQEKLSDNGNWYLSNMTKGNTGNVFTYGEPYLYVKIKDTRSYTTAQLWKGNNLIQIEQSKAGEPVRLEMFTKKNDTVLPMARGEYTLKVTGDKGTSDSTGINDKFQIV